MVNGILVDTTMTAVTIVDLTIAVATQALKVIVDAVVTWSKVPSLAQAAVPPAPPNPINKTSSRRSRQADHRVGYQIASNGALINRLSNQWAEPFVARRKLT